MQLADKNIFPSQSSSPSPNKDKHHSREFRMEITLMQQGVPQGQFFAYCVVSKESSMGLLVHQRLLVLDSFRNELSYYSDIPELPLLHPKQLANPKQIVNFKTAHKFEFVLQRIRIGHVTVKWQHQNEQKSWKLIMGSNGVAKQFYQLMQKSIKQKQSKKNDGRKQLKIDHKNDVKTFPVAASEPVLHSPKTNNNNIVKYQFQQANQIDVLQNSIQKEHKNIVFYNKFKQETKSISEPTQPFNPLQNQPHPNPQQQPSSQLVHEWLHASNNYQKATVYQNFINKCKQTVQSTMTSFFTNHLKHSQEDGLYVWYHDQIKIMYLPLLDSFESNASTLINKIKQEQTFLRQLQNMNYMCQHSQVQDMKIAVPMTCIVHFNSFNFLCKTTINHYHPKSIIQSWSSYSHILASLQQKIHTKVSNGMQKAYLLHLINNSQCIYFQQLCCLPQLSPLQPVTAQYIHNYLTKGAISSPKDIKAIKEHIHTSLLDQTIQIMHSKQVSTCFQLEQTLKQMGMSHHYLPLLLKQLLKNKSVSSRNYLQRLIMSQVVALGVTWQARTKMQQQYFKKKQQGQILHQLKLTITKLIQGDKPFLASLTHHLQLYFQQSYNLNIYPIDSYIIPQNTVISILHKLSIDCHNVYIPEQEVRGWIYHSKNIINNIDFVPSIAVHKYTHRCFCGYQPDFLEKGLYQEHTFQLNHQTTLFSVLSYLQLEQNTSGFHSVSPSYDLLNPNSRIQVDHYLSHFIPPSPQQNTNLLQTALYNFQNNLNYNIHSLQYLTTLNKIRWLIKQKQEHQVHSLITSTIKKALIWNQPAVLIQIYGFYSQFRRKVGDMPNALLYSQKALSSAFQFYQNQKTVLVALLIAQQAFEAANMHLSINNYSKAFELYNHTQAILKRLTTQGQQFTINPQFLLLYSRKCSIHLLFGQYELCLNQCLQGLQKCSTFKPTSPQLDKYQLKIYEILFRCYQMQKMRNQMMQISDICSRKYISDKIARKQPILPDLLSDVVKLLWNSLVKQAEGVVEQGSQDRIKFVYLKKVLQELRLLPQEVKTRRYSRKQASHFLVTKIESIQNKNQNPLKYTIIQTLIEITNASTQPTYINPMNTHNITNEWTTLQCLSCLVGYEYLIGTVQSSLHIYSF